MTINLQMIRLIVVCFCVMLWGCAKSELKLTLSVYQDDPQLKSILLKQEVRPIGTQLEQLDAQVDDFVRQQIKFAKDAYTVYEEAWHIDAKVTSKVKNIPYDANAQKKTDDALKPFESQRDQYIEQLTKEKLLLQREISQAKSIYTNLLRQLPDDFNTMAPSDANMTQSMMLQRTSLSQAITNVYQRLSRLVDAPYYQSLKHFWDYLYQRASSDLYKKHLDKKDLDRLYTSIAKIARELSSVPNPLVSLRSKTLTDAVATADNQAISEAFRQQMMINPVFYRISAKEEAKIFSSIDLLNSQLARLQNAGSPIWRVVTDPANKKRWNTKFSQTYFKAEGEAGVVVVRDSPMQYRVQQAHNNPAALVEAQLQISRAVANSAIQIAGAMSGVPMTSILSGKSDTNPEYSQDTDTFVTRKATVNAQKAVYQKTVTAIEANLDSYLRQLAAIDAKDQEAIKILNQEIVIYLTAQQLRLGE